MATIFDYTCPIDGLRIDVTDPMGTWSEYLATIPVGAESDFWCDFTVTCANNHAWGVRFKVEIGRVA